MPKLSWFRVYTEILDDMKLRSLTGDQKWDWVCLLALARESSEPGVVCGTAEDAAWRLRRPLDEFEESLRLFEERGMVEVRPGRIIVTHFLARQYDKQSDRPDATRDRKRRSRANHAGVTLESRGGHADQNGESRPSHATDTDTDTDTDSDSDVQDSSAPTANKPPYPPKFEAFWSAYPRHDEKRKAFRVWQARIRAGVKPDELVRAATLYAAKVAREGTLPKFVKLAATFLGPDEHWKESLSTSPPRPPTHSYAESTARAVDLVSHIYGAPKAGEEADDEPDAASGR